MPDNWILQGSQPYVSGVLSEHNGHFRHRADSEMDEEHQVGPEVRDNAYA